MFANLYWRRRTYPFLPPAIEFHSDIVDSSSEVRNSFFENARPAFCYFLMLHLLLLLGHRRWDPPPPPPPS